MWANLRTWPAYCDFSMCDEESLKLAKPLQSMSCELTEKYNLCWALKFGEWEPAAQARIFLSCLLPMYRFSCVKRKVYDDAYLS